MAEEHLDNPAGRLHSILKSARETITATPNHNGVGGWAETFGLSLGTKEQELEVFHRIFEVGRLVDELEERIELIEEAEDREAFLSPIARFKAIAPLAEARNANFSSLLAPITQGDMIVLEFCSRHLHRFQPEAVADREALEELTHEVDELFNLVSSLELERDFKIFLLSQIERVRRGIQEYRIGGIERLRETLGEVLGAAMVNQDIVTSNKESEELKRFIQIADKLIAIVEFSSKTTKLISSVSAFLPHLLKPFQG